jgi:hypothetical protein
VPIPHGISRVEHPRNFNVAPAESPNKHIMGRPRHIFLFVDLVYLNATFWSPDFTLSVHPLLGSSIAWLDRSAAGRLIGILAQFIEAISGLKITRAAYQNRCAWRGLLRRYVNAEAAADQWSAAALVPATWWRYFVTS